MIDTDLPINRDQPIEKCPPHDITFKNLTYNVEIQPKEQHNVLPCFKTLQSKTLINNATGIFKAGQLTAIMGASGSGKTTFLNILACRLPSQQVKGSVTVNGQPYSYENFGDFANYVMQHDILIQTLTVRETLNFVADLTLNASEADKRTRIQLLSRKLKLEKCMDVLVGGSLISGISGGERKRTSIAFQLISNPSVLILDEPTSGLDSFTSFIIVRYLKRLAYKEGKTIFMTIHQPNSDIYALFDQLFLLVEGRFIYQGPASEAKDYFAKNFNLICPQFHNPADFFMSIMHHQNPKNCQRFPLYFQTYDKLIVPQVQQLIQNQSKAAIKKRTIQVTLSQSFKTLVRRDFLNVIRNPLLIKLRFGQTAFMSLYAGGVYYHFTQDYMDPLNWRALTGFFFFLTISLTMMSLAPVQLVFPSERPVFLKEESAKLYGTFIYFISRNIIEIPYSIIFPLMQSLIMYWFVGLASTASQFFTFYFVAYLLAFTGMSMGLMLGSIVSDMKSVSVLTPLILLPINLFSGFFKNIGNLSSWFGWIQYLSPIKYGFAAFVQNQVQFANKSRVDELNFDGNLWLSIGLLIVLGFSFRLVSLFSLWRLRKRLE